MFFFLPFFNESTKSRHTWKPVFHERRLICFLILLLDLNSYFPYRRRAIHSVPAVVKSKELIFNTGKRMNTTGILDFTGTATDDNLTQLSLSL